MNIDTLPKVEVLKYDTEEEKRVVDFVGRYLGLSVSGDMEGCDPVIVILKEDGTLTSRDLDSVKFKKVRYGTSEG